ncbi:hypothetical protein D3C81_1411110 [compost metagenome]
MAIDFDATALAHQIALQQRRAGHLRQPRCHRAIVARTLLAAPTIEVEVDQAKPAVAIGDETAAVVTHPDVVQRHVEKFDVVTAAALLRLPALCRAAQHADRLMAGDGARQPGDSTVHRIGLRAPYPRLCGEGQEHALLRPMLIGHLPPGRCSGTGAGGQSGQTQRGQAAQAGGCGELGDEMASGRHDRLQRRTVKSS